MIFDFWDSNFAADFAVLDVQLVEKAEVILDEGPFHRGRGAVVRMVAVKP